MKNVFQQQKNVIALCTSNIVIGDWELICEKISMRNCW